MAELTSPPEFGADGTPPPLQSAPVPVGRDFFFTRSTTGDRAIWALLAGSGQGREYVEARQWVQKNRDTAASVASAGSSPCASAWPGQGLRTEAAESSNSALGVDTGVNARSAFAAVGGLLAASVLAPPLAGVAAGAIVSAKLYKNKKRNAALRAPTTDSSTVNGELQLSRVTCTKRWRRNEDEIVQLPPGSKRTTTSQVTIGITLAKTEELSLALGLEGTAGWAKLNSELTATLGRTITLTEERQTSESIELCNDDKGSLYRRYALWYPEYTVQVSALVETSGGISWQDRAAVTFVPPNAIALTYTGFGAV